MEHNLGLE